MLQREESRHDFAFIAGVIVGAIAGAAVTLALTPMSGAETREKLKARTGDLSQVKERAAGMASSVPQMVAPVRERAAQVATAMPTKIRPVKERAATVAHAVPQVVAPVKEKVGEMVAKAPRPGQHAAQDELMGESIDASTHGFGPHGAHTQAPAEGDVNTTPRATDA